MDRELAQIRARETKAVKDPRVKALRVIDMLTCDDEFADNKLLSTIYRVAHSASGICGNAHEDWQQEAAKLYDSLKKA